MQGDIRVRVRVLRNTGYTGIYRDGTFGCIFWPLVDLVSVVHVEHIEYHR